MKVNIRFLTVIISSIFLTACFSRVDPRWKSVEDMALVRDDLKVRTCELIKKRSLQIDSLKALYLLDFDIGSGTQSLRLSVAFKSPDKLRAEILPPNLAVAMFLGISTKEYGLLLDLIEKKASSFDESTKMLSKLIDLDLPAEDLVYILSARVPMRHIDRLCAGANTENDIYFKYAPDGAGVSIIDLKQAAFWTVNMESGLLRTALLRKGINGKSIIATDYIEDDYAEPGNEFPREQTAVIENNLVTVRIQTITSKINSAIKPQLFKMSVPVGFKEKHY